MELAAQIGVNITDFWDMTPCELSIYARGYAKRQETDNDVRLKSNMLQAYLISRWVWQKRVDIKKLLQNETKHEVMTDEDMLQKVLALNAVFGGSVHKEALT